MKLHALALVVVVSTLINRLPKAFAQGTCSSTSPCTSGCCGKSGYCGFGPDYCGQGNCISNCDAQAECGQYAPSNSTLCPLNVCCSQYGFCGTTSDFCGTGCQSGCEAVTPPSCGGSSSNQRRIGYYESWSPTRPCDVWYPETIDPLAWTHINYAFALIDENFGLSQMNSWDTDFYTRMIGLKSQNPSLKIFISVGGWAAGGKVFSDLVSSEANRQAFISSSLSFLATYGFDGMDIDWEYPAAGDRGGVPADTENYVTFVRELKTALGSGYGLSLTLPTSYWYLQGFDVVGLQTWTDWFNFMAYDIHGTWDGNNPYTQAVVQPHTNLTEIALGLDLLWRNLIDPRHVVLGLGFYGRSFTLKDPACNAPGCPFSGGGNPGNCTGTSGILSNAEIQAIIAEYDLDPILNEEAAIKYISWDSNQWVSYDDGETYGLKAQFANKHCLSGLMAWAVDLDNPSTEASAYSLASNALSNNQLPPSLAIRQNYARLRYIEIPGLFFWTPCDLASEGYCPIGTRAMAQGQGKVYDVDRGTLTGPMACHGGPGGSYRTLCKQDNVITGTCQWFGLPAACIGSCPRGWLKVTGNSSPLDFGAIDCPAGRYSVYCCDTIEISADPSACPLSLFNWLLSDGFAPRLEDNKQLLLRDASDSNNNPGCNGCCYQGTNNGNPFCVACTCTSAAPTSTSAPPPATSTAAQLVPKGVPVYQACDPNLLFGGIQVGVPGYLVGNLVVPPDDVLDPQTVHVTETISPSISYTTTTRTCDGAVFPSACLHYSSVIRKNPDQSLLTCSQLRVAKAPRPIVAMYDRQHYQEGKIGWIKGWTQLAYAPNKKGKLTADGCDRDEWPPAYFWQGRPGQWIRLLSRTQNRGVPQGPNGWKGLCGMGPKEDPAKANIIELGCDDGLLVVTCSWIKEPVISWPVMEYQFTNMPIILDDGITENFCWPKTLTNDPGFALLTQDPWYTNSHINMYSSADYAKKPALAVTQGKTMPTNPNLRRRWDLDPESLFINEGNTSRRPTEEELFNAFGFWKCETESCLGEEELLGVRVELALDSPKPVAAVASDAWTLSAAEGDLRPPTNAPFDTPRTSSKATDDNRSPSTVTVMPTYQSFSA